MVLNNFNLMKVNSVNKIIYFEMNGIVENLYGEYNVIDDLLELVCKYIIIK